MAKTPPPPPSFIDLLKAYPWLGPLLAASVIVTLWVATRRPPPPPEPIPQAVEPVTAAPEPAPEMEPAPEPFVWPSQQPAEEPAAVQAPPAPPTEARAPLPVNPDAPLAGAQRLDGTFEPGPGAPKIAP